MADTILYAKQQVRLVKAVTKAQEALSDVFQTLAEVGITPSATLAAEETPRKETRGRKPKAKKEPKAAKGERVSRSNGDAAYEI